MNIIAWAKSLFAPSPEELQRRREFKLTEEKAIARMAANLREHDDAERRAIQEIEVPEGKVFLIMPMGYTVEEALDLCDALNAHIQDNPQEKFLPLPHGVKVVRVTKEEVAK